jgi:protein-disulfide isomerase
MNTKFALGAVAAALVLAGGLFFGLQPGSQQTQFPPLGAVGAQTSDTNPETSAMPEPFEIVMGNPDAPVTLIEYASYTCPHCATFHANVLKPLTAEYIDTGKIKFIYREVFFDRYGLWAAMIARCGGEERYPGISALLYETQAEWAGAGDAPQVIEGLRRVGLRAGFTGEELDTCLQNGELAQAMVAKFQRDAEEHDINSTPSLVINGKKHGNMSYESLKKLLDEALAQ